MKKKLLLISLAVLFCTAATDPDQKKIKIYIAGDSTARAYNPEETLMRGWAQELHRYLNDSVEIVNRAMGGNSSRNFIEQDRWLRIVDELQPGDYVMIQFGHNDTSPVRQRHATPEQYKANLMKFCTEATEKGANPIILTSIVMRTFFDGELEDRRDRFAEYIQYARDIAAEAGVPLIDHHVLTTDLVRSLGDEPSKELYYHVKPGEHPRITNEMKDDTHLREKGADAFAKLVADELKKMDIPLSKYVK